MFELQYDKIIGQKRQRFQNDLRNNDIRRIKNMERNKHLRNLNCIKLIEKIIKENAIDFNIQFLVNALQQIQQNLYLISINIDYQILIQFYIRLMNQFNENTEQKIIPFLIILVKTLKVDLIQSLLEEILLQDIKEILKSNLTKNIIRLICQICKKSKHCRNHILHNFALTISELLTNQKINSLIPYFFICLIKEDIEQQQSIIILQLIPKIYYCAYYIPCHQTSLLMVYLFRLKNKKINDMVLGFGYLNDVWFRNIYQRDFQQNLLQVLIYYFESVDELIGFSIILNKILELELENFVSGLDLCEQKIFIVKPTNINSQFLDIQDQNWALEINIDTKNLSSLLGTLIKQSKIQLKYRFCCIINNPLNYGVNLLKIYSSSHLIIFIDNSHQQ